MRQWVDNRGDNAYTTILKAMKIKIIRATANKKRLDMKPREINKSDLESARRYYSGVFGVKYADLRFDYEEVCDEAR